MVKKCCKCGSVDIGHRYTYVPGINVILGALLIYFRLPFGGAGIASGLRRVDFCKTCKSTKIKEVAPKEV